MTQFLEKLKDPDFWPFWGHLAKFSAKRIFSKKCARSVFRFYNIYHHAQKQKKLISGYQEKLLTGRQTDRQTETDKSTDRQTEINGSRKFPQVLSQVLLSLYQIRNAQIIGLCLKVLENCLVIKQNA